MNVKKILVTEIEKRNILKMYGLLKEEDPKTSPTKELRQNVFFDAGYHSKKYLGDELDGVINEIKEYLKNSPGKTFITYVSLKAYESKIPNTDAEAGNKELKPKELAQKRLKTIQEYITEKMKSLVDSGSILQLPKIILQPVEQGATKWVGQPFCPEDKLKPEDKEIGRACLLQNFNPGVGSDGKQITNWKNGKDAALYAAQRQQYKTEQKIFVYITLTEVSGDAVKCLTNMEINFDYTDTSKEHVCNNALYVLRINDKQIYRSDGEVYASLNNNGGVHDSGPKCTQDNKKTNACQRFNKFIITPELAKEIISNQNFKTTYKGLLNLSVTCASQEKWSYTTMYCHEGVPNLTIKTGQGLTTTIDVNSDSMPTGKLQTSIVAKLDPCGNQIK